MEVQSALIPSAANDDFLLRLYNLHVPAGKRPYRPHKHIELEIALFKSGTGTYATAGKTYSIQAGDIFLFSSNEPHFITEIGGSGQMVLMNLQFEPRFIWSTGNDLFDARFLEIFFDRSDRFENRIDRGNPAIAQIRRLLLEIEQEFYQKPIEYALMVKVKLLAILVALIRSFDYVDMAGSSGCGYREQLRVIAKSMDYIMKHLGDPLTLAGIAGVAGLSTTYYSAAFKKLNGISPWEYIMVKRVERAAALLRSCPDEKILDIAFECGFNNTANFNKAFRKVMGQTPSAYKDRRNPVFY